MLPGLELMGCQGLAVPAEVMHHVVRVESSYNPYAIGVVGGRLVRQPRNLPEALATVRMLEGRGFNFSIGLAQVNRYNLRKYGLTSYEKAFETCANIAAGSKILAECYHRAGGDWGKAFSCYYSGNFATGFRHGYVQKIYASLRQDREGDDAPGVAPIDVVERTERRTVPVSRMPLRGAEPARAVVATGLPAPAPAAASTGMPAAIVDATGFPAFAAPAVPPLRSRAERARDARTVPIARTEAIESAPQPRPESDAFAQVPVAVPAAPAAVAPRTAVARAVPTGSTVGVARAVSADTSAAGAPAPAQLRQRTGDQALVAADPEDEARVF